MIYVVSYGLISAVGPTATLSVAAVNAGANAFQASTNINKNNAPMITAQIPAEALPVLADSLIKEPLTQQERRLIQLAIPAIQEVSKSLKKDAPIPLFLAGPESIVEANRSGARRLIIKYIAEMAGVNIDLPSSRYLASGRTGVIEAIELAYRYFAVSASDFVLIGGVDSYLDAITLGTLDADDRIKAENILDGFVPGEAAGFLLLSRIKLSDRCVGVHQPALEMEEGSYYSDKPYRGDALSKAVSTAINQGQGKKISGIYSSMNGEHYFSKEYGVSVIRNASTIAAEYKIFHPADSWGDIGAATGVGLIALSAAHLFKTQDDLCHLIYASSDGPNRAAVCVERI